jgi:carbamoyltransferase
MSGAYLGPTFDDDEIEAALVAKGLAYHRIDDDDEIARRIAESLSRGEILGHFDGRMEFGPRALGNRSILADPRSAGTLGRVNQKIKFREGWRPFAPIVLASHAADIFDAPTESPYMLLVSHLKMELRGGPTLSELRGQGIDSLSRLQECGPADYASVTHVDYSARIQTIDGTSPSRAGRILRSFYDLTGFPMLLNTSFNVRGEPIVCTPTDAIDCFLNTNLDLLAIGHFLVERIAQPPTLVGRAGKKKFDAD